MRVLGCYQSDRIIRRDGHTFMISPALFICQNRPTPASLMRVFTHTWKHWALDRWKEKPILLWDTSASRYSILLILLLLTSLWNSSGGILKVSQYQGCPILLCCEIEWHSIILVTLGGLGSSVFYCITLILCMNLLSGVIQWEILRSVETMCVLITTGNILNTHVIIYCMNIVMNLWHFLFEIWKFLCH